MHLPPGDVFTSEIDFFRLFYTPQQVDQIAQFTNTYADVHIDGIKRYQNGDGRWTPATGEEIYKFLGLLVYSSLVRVTDFDRMYSRKTLFNGMWAREFISTCERA